MIAARRIKNREAEGAHLGNLGKAYAHLGETHKAIEHYEQALIIDREITAEPHSETERMATRRAEGTLLCNLGSAYYRTCLAFNRVRCRAQVPKSLERASV